MIVLSHYLCAAFVMRKNGVIFNQAKSTPFNITLKRASGAASSDLPYTGGISPFSCLRYFLISNKSIGAIFADSYLEVISSP